MNRQRDAHRPPEERNARYGEESRQRVGECQKEFHDSFPFMPAHHHQLLGQKRDIQAGRDYNAQDEGNNPFFAYRSSCVGMYMPHILGQEGKIVKHCPSPAGREQYTDGIAYVVF